jgi:formate-dependent nitrite reductase membrane component NrfD
MNVTTARQWMVTHEWMVKPMRQFEWISRKGLLVWLAEVFSALGMGLYLVALFADHWWAQLVGWGFIVVFKLPLHFLYLGRPWRFWRAIPPFTKAWKTSWFARGMFFSMVYVAFGTVQLATTYLLQHHLVAGGGHDAILAVDWIARVVAGIFVVLVGVYCGFAMSYCKSVPFWNTGLLPVVFVVMGVADGLALLMGIGLVAGDVNMTALESLSRIALIINAMLIVTYLTNASYQSSTAGLSVKDLIRGQTATVFWGGIVVLGIAVPLAISVASVFTGEATSPVLISAVVCHTIGAFSLKYAVLKVGIYRPILPKVAVY